MGSFSGVELPKQYNDFFREAQHIPITVVGDGNPVELIASPGVNKKIVVVHYTLTSNGGGFFQFTDGDNGGIELSGPFTIIDTFGTGQSFEISPGWCPHGLFVTLEVGNVELTYTGDFGVETLAGHMTYLVVQK